MAMIKSEPIEIEIEIDRKENFSISTTIDVLRREKQQLIEENQRLKDNLIRLNNDYENVLTELNDVRKYLLEMLKQIE